VFYPLNLPSVELCVSPIISPRAGVGWISSFH